MSEFTMHKFKLIQFLLVATAWLSAGNVAGAQQVVSDDRSDRGVKFSFRDARPPANRPIQIRGKVNQRRQAPLRRQVSILRTAEQPISTNKRISAPDANVRDREQAAVPRRNRIKKTQTGHTLDAAKGDLPAPDPTTAATNAIRISSLPAAAQPLNNGIATGQPAPSIAVRETPAKHFVSHPGAAGNVVIHPPQPLPYQENQFAFLLENTGTSPARDVTFEVVVNGGAIIRSSVPSNTMITDNRLVLKMGSLGPGERQPVQVLADLGSGIVKSFDTQLTFTQSKSFAPEGTSFPMRHEPLPRLGSTSSKASIPVAGSSQETTQRQQFALRPGFKGNPFFVGATRKAADSPVELPAALNERQSVSGSGRYARQPQVTPHQAFQLAATRVPQKSANTPNAPPKTDSWTIEEVAPFADEADVAVMIDVAGDQDVRLNGLGDFRLTLENASDVDVSDLLIQVGIPKGLEMHEIDRETWYDEASRTVSFRVESLPANDVVEVAYRLKAIKTGFQIQKATAEWNGGFQAEVTLDTLVVE